MICRSHHHCNLALTRRGLLLGTFGIVLNTGALHAQTGARRVGEVERISGGAELHRDGKSLFLTPGLAIEENDRILTAQGARLEIVFSDGSRLVLADLTDVSVVQFAPRAGGSGRAVIDLAFGLIRIVSHLSGGFGRFEVRTATAIASVRSTDWIVGFGNDSSAVFVREGRVAVSDIQGRSEVVLRPGFGTDVARGAPPNPPTRWGAPRVASVETRLGLR